MNNQRLAAGKCSLSIFARAFPKGRHRLQGVVWLIHIGDDDTSLWALTLRHGPRSHVFVVRACLIHNQLKLLASICLAIVTNTVKVTFNSEMCGKLIIAGMVIAVNW
jgi:hypothetical protein